MNVVPYVIFQQVYKMAVKERKPAGQSNGHANGNGKTSEYTTSGTDLTRWRMRDDRGRQTWHYLQTDEELKAWPMTTADKWYLGLETVGMRPISFP